MIVDKYRAIYLCYSIYKDKRKPQNDELGLMFFMLLLTLLQ